jgi:hypothetical protein
VLTVDPALAAHRRHYPSVSLLVPIDGPTPWAARLRRLQRKANLRLLVEFDGNPDERLLAHLDDAVVNAEAPHGARSLAVYASSEGCDWVGLAVHVRERVVVDDTFATRDLVHHDLRSPRYWVLALSLEHPRLLRGHGSRLHPQTLPLRDTVEHPSTSRDHRSRDRSDAIEARRTRRLRALDMAISEAVGDDPDPLVVVGVEPTLSRFLGRTGHISRVEGAVRRAADPSLTALAATVAPSVAEMLTERRVIALHQLDQAVGAGRASSGLDQVWRHARRERGALLLVEEHFEVAARLRADGTLQRAEDPDAPDVIDDVVDELIEIVLSRQGRLEIVPDGTLATHQRIALVPARKGKR